MTNRRSFSRAFKLGICSRVVSGETSKAQATREHRLSPSLLDRWMAQYQAQGQEAFQRDHDQQVLDLGARVRELEGVIGRLYAENELLKEALKRGKSQPGSVLR